MEDESFRVDTETDDRDEFFWSLLNQFQKIFGLPETEREIIAIPIDELSPQKIRKEFLAAVNRYNVMKIIRRKPAVLNWDDSAYLNLFLKQMGQMNLNCVPYNDALCASIKGFIIYLHDQTMSLDAALSSRFKYQDETASVNMEDDTESAADSEMDLNPLGLSTLSETINDAIDAVVADATDRAIADAVDKAIADTTTAITEAINNARLLGAHLQSAAQLVFAERVSSGAFRCRFGLPILKLLLQPCGWVAVEPAMGR